MLDGIGRPLFSALRALDRPDSSAGRLWRAAELVREHRGDGHLAALVAVGLGAAEANVLTELWLGFGRGEYSGTRGFGSDALAAATDAGEWKLVDACGPELDELIAGADAISARLIGSRSFPADPRKRAGG